MPPIFIALAVVVETIAESEILSFLVMLGASIVLGEISKMFQKSASSSLSTSNRTVTSRQAIAPRRVIYGSTRVGGVISFIGTTGAANQGLDLGGMIH